MACGLRFGEILENGYEYSTNKPKVEIQNTPPVNPQHRFQVMPHHFSVVMSAVVAYRTQRDQAYDRASSRADRIRNRLGREPGILNDAGGKPKGMHWRTFERLQAARFGLLWMNL
jgi:hypothetical protein